MTGAASWVGVGVALVVHGAVVALAAFSPPTQTVAPQQRVELDTCTSVVTPSCVGSPVDAGREDDRAAQPRSRRCPEPMRRARREELARLPASQVDLLVAELVQRRGVAHGVESSASGASSQAGQKKPTAVQRVSKLTGSKLDSILGGGQRAERRRQQLGAILGTANGAEDGDGLVQRSGSAYARELKRSVLRHFRVPGNVPPWLRKSLVCRVRILTMTATGRVISYRMERRSGNVAFDGAVRRLMNGYKAGIRSLPKPPRHLLSAINSRGFVIDFR